MSFKNIVAFIDGSESKFLMESALELGAEFTSHVNICHLLVDAVGSVPFLGEGMCVAMVEELLESSSLENKKRLALAHSEYEQLLASRNLSNCLNKNKKKPHSSWTVIEGFDKSILSGIASMSDLLIASQPAGNRTYASNFMLHKVLQESSGSLLTIPNVKYVPFPLKNVLIYWNGTFGSTRAIRSSIPLLKKSETVSIIANYAGEREFPNISELKNYLGCYDVPIADITTVNEKKYGAQQLLNKANEINANLLVMGAFTRKGLKSLLFKRITRKIMEKANIPIFLTY